MPVSKKRMKDGKPVHRKVPSQEPAAHAPGHEGGEPGPAPQGGARRITGKPANPFVAQQAGRRGSQRGR
jgi:hypothetical protein